MRITPRCIDLLTLLCTARWLTTSQIQRRFFPRATPDAVRKRLRKLTSGKYLLMVRRDRMTQALFTIGPEGKRILETGTESVQLERKPPTQLDHFVAINDLRIAAEMAAGLQFFYSAWELPGIGWKQPIIPDGLAAFASHTFALEFDSGAEGVKFFVSTKMTVYQRGLDNFPLAAVLIVTDRSARMMSLAKAIGDQQGRVLFTTLQSIRSRGLLAPVFYAEPGRWGVSLVERLSSQTLST